MNEPTDPRCDDGAVPPVRTGNALMDRAIQQLLAPNRDYAFLLFKKDGTIVDWQGSAERLFGYSAAEAIGKPAALLFTPEDVARGMDVQEINVALTAGRSEDERWHRRKDGQRFWGSGVMSAVVDSDGAVLGLCKIVRDRTDVRAQIETLEHRIETRDAEIDRRQAFFASTVHELRNPLGPLAMAMQLLQRELTDEKRDRALAVLGKQMGVLTNLIEDLSQGVYETAAQLRLHLQPVMLGETLRQLMEGQRPQAEASQLALSLTLPPKEILVLADPRRLEQMLQNLVGNALKYTPAGGWVAVSASVEADMAVIRIEDDGIGIGADVLPHIFELFTREGRKREVQGLGVGLAVVQRLATLHAGNVEVRSPGPGKGSIFALRLPLAPDGRPAQ